MKGLRGKKFEFNTYMSSRRSSCEWQAVTTFPKSL